MYKIYIETKHENRNGLVLSEMIQAGYLLTRPRNYRKWENTHTHTHTHKRVMANSHPIKLLKSPALLVLVIYILAGILSLFSDLVE